MEDRALGLTRTRDFLVPRGRKAQEKKDDEKRGHAAVIHW